MNTEMLKKRIVAECSIKEFASRVGMDESTLYRKLDSGRFTIKEANTIVTNLKLNKKDANLIFFSDSLA